MEKNGVHQSGTERLTAITGFVLAGGRSSRMGRDKTKLQLGGLSMLQRTVALLRSVCGEVAVLGPDSDGLNVPVFADELPGRGPLGAIYTGLRSTSTEFNLVVACDLAFLEARFLVLLGKRALAKQADVTLPASPGNQIEPLCAVYRRRALRTIRAYLETGRNKVGEAVSQLRSEVIPWDEIARAGFPPGIFGNINTPEDYQFAERALAAVNRERVKLTTDC